MAITKKTIGIGYTTIRDEKLVSIHAIKQGKGGEEKMILTTTYLENLPSPNYKTKQFSRSVTETLPDDIDKPNLEARAARQASLVETLVKNDIARHIEEAAKG
jgi:hypothetical protein